MRGSQAFDEAYGKLNAAQREAVKALDGPVMVVAGPGTGKTQVLAMRIANILTKTDTEASGILCLTFTNAGVRAMRERLLSLIGPDAGQVHISTFHRFSITLIEKYFSYIGFAAKPELMGDAEAVALVDEILEGNAWQHIRPRGDAARYFGDLKSLVSLLKREGLAPDQFADEVSIEIARIQEDPANISSRGARKGELKMEALKQIEALERTREAVEFYRMYEDEKKARGLMDYDDVLAYAVELARASEDARADIRERYLYVLVDEHQDSSGVQNAFLEAVWGDSPVQPNIFVVGDDRQLIYGFAGSSLDHFTRFRTMFGKAREITLTENYRSSQVILDAADALLSSTIASGTLVAASSRGAERIVLAECAYPRDEIISIARDISRRIAPPADGGQGESPQDFAVLVPKNYQVRDAVRVLRDQGVPVSAAGSASFFAAPETGTVRCVLRVIHDPYDAVALADLLLDPRVGIPPLIAHAFLRETGARSLSLEKLVHYGTSRLGTDPIARLGAQLAGFLEASQKLGLHGLLQKIGEKLFFTAPPDHDALIRGVEVVRTFLHLISAQMEKDEYLSTGAFLAYLDRLEQYGHELPLAVFSADRGVRVLTLHGSKGLEWKHVYIAHMDDASLMRGKRMGFALPERIAALVADKDELAARRELYVAITRAKEFCRISWPLASYTGAALEPARLLADVPEALVERLSLADTEGELLAEDPKLFVAVAPERPRATMAELAGIVAEEYPKLNVSVTLLNNFFECPWKWYFRNLLQLPESKTESLLLGSAVHMGIEFLLKHRGGERSGHAAALAAAVAASLEKEYVADTRLIERTKKDALKILANFEKNYLPGIAEDAQSERSVSYRDPALPHLSCYGKIDLTERDGDRVVTVTDFKTGSPKGKSAIEKRDGEGRMSGLLRQLAMYSYLIQNAERGTDVRASRLLFLEADPDDKDSLYERAIGAEEIAALKQDIADYDALLQSGQWTARSCQAKLYGSARECEYCARAKQLYAA